MKNITRKAEEMLNKKEQLLSGKAMRQKSLRLWPGIIIVTLQWLARYVIPAIDPGMLIIGIFGGVLCGLAVVIWWAFFSRAPRLERWGAILLMIAALAATSQILDVSIKTANMGMMFLLFSIPVLSLAFVAWAVATRNLSNGARHAIMVAVIIVASGFWGLLRTEGMDGENHHELVWRWSMTAEERLLARGKDALVSLPADPSALAAEAEWPGFRGHNRDAVIHGIKIAAGWDKVPPAELWRRPVGPACSSVAIQGSLLFTQEQRGEYEMVNCYNLYTGEPVWEHRDSTRFWDSHAGAGPRSTPTLHNGRLYTCGATGMLNVLNIQDGTVFWSRDAAADTKVQIPGWGYTGSPLVADRIVIVAVAGRLAAYETASGDPLWFGSDGGESYSSPHLMTFDGVRQVIFMNKAGVTGYLPADGSELWKLPWPGVRIIQPAQIADNDILADAGDIKGLKRVTIKKSSGGWTTEERWSSNRLRPNFNDFVVHKDHAYGFEGPCLVCMDTGNGERKWKGGRYGGQILLLADQDMLLVLSEEGVLALVKAIPEKLSEITRFPVIEGKTWNHPAMAGNILVVRNSLEMAAFRLPLDGN